MQEEASTNLLGALIFWTYIAAALYFSGSILTDLVHLYNHSHDPKRIRLQGVHRTSQQHQHARKFVVLALISFTMLSYQMLSFLLRSYGSWSKRKSPLYHQFSAGESTQLLANDFANRVWSWSMYSTLFKDFATEICSTPQRFWWTQQALLYSLGWNIYMSIEGARYQVPHLWTYFVLGQILPNSFTQNLFSVALFLLSDSNMNKSLEPATITKQWSLLLLFFASLLVAPLVVDTPFYLASLLATRMLLFAPLFIVRPTIRKNSNLRTDISLSSFFVFKTLGSIIALLLHIVQTYKAGAPQQYLAVLNDSHAVAALGYDYILGVFSVWILWYCRRQGSVA